MSDPSNQSQNGSAGSTGPTPPQGWEALKAHMVTNKIDVAMWATRVFTLLFTVAYFIPIFTNPYNAYHKALVCSAVTSGLRLQQRLVGQSLSLSRELLGRLLLEDSAHYLIYSLIFLYVQPNALILLPVFLFALLHAASYSLPLLDTLGQNSWWGARLLISLVEFQSRSILRAAALVEVLLAPATLLMLFAGRAGLLTPFVYYHFLTLRYTSRRNPYTRNTFAELRMFVEKVAAKPACPGPVRNALLATINGVSRLAPPQVPAN